MADSQDIEGKLAAYVDGELPADARTEIEKYLSANPQQRRLIADLMRQRDLLQALPKNAAPADVAESLNAQLERAVLLGDVDAEATAATIRPWRSVAGLAAVLLLMAGLGLTIYSLLPSPNRKPKDLTSINTIPGTHPSERDESVIEPPAVPTTRPAVTEQEQRAREALDRQSEPSVAVAQSKPQATVAMPSMSADLSSQATRNAAEADAMSLALPPATAPAAEAVAGTSIDIATADASATRSQVVHTLMAIGGTVVPATTQPDVLVVQIEPAQMSQAVAITRSFQLPSITNKEAAKATTEPALNPANMKNDANAMAGGAAQAQFGEQQMASNAPSPIASATTLPSEVVKIRLIAAGSRVEPTTVPATEPTSNPTTQP